MDKDEALKLIEQNYIETFNEKPDANTKMMMQMSAQRVADGEKFKWENNGQWKVKMALNAMSNKMESDNHGNPLTKYDEALQRAIDAGVEALATHKESLLVQPTIKESLKVEQPVQEPVALKFPTMLRKMWSGGEVQEWLDKQQSLYTHPAPSWQGLSDDEIVSIWVQTYDEKDIRQVCRAIEQALRSKNGN